MNPQLEAARSETVERLMLTHPSYDASYDRVVRLLKAIAGTDSAVFSVIDGPRQFIKAKEGLDARETERDTSFCTHTIEQTGLMLVPNAHEDERFASNPLVTAENGISFYAGLPVRAPSGLPLGALCVIDSEPHDFPPDQAEALGDLRALLEEVILLRSLSVLDPLTGLNNRRHFEDVVRRDWTRGFAAQAPLAVVMVDIDHFKRYNDHYGHAEGDVCLKAVAVALRDGARRVGDVLARIGGEEFALVLPNVLRADAERLGEKLRAAVAALQLPHAAAPLGRVSLSIGIALVADPQAEPFDSCLQRADQALYTAKAQGRDCAVIAAD